MANLKNWLPDFTLEERAWFDKCPKAVLFEIARQFGMRIADDFTAEAAFTVMQQEWDALHANGVVPQKQPKVLLRESRRHTPVRLGDLINSPRKD